MGERASIVRRIAALGIFALLCVPLANAAAMQDRMSDESVKVLRGPLASAARVRVPRVSIDGVSRNLDLERFEVWASNAEIIAESAGKRERLSVPTTRFFRGRIEGESDSLVFLQVDEGVSGFIQSADRRYDVRSRVTRIHGTPSTAETFIEQSAEFQDSPDFQPFTCGVEGKDMDAPASLKPRTDSLSGLIPVTHNGNLATGTATHTLLLAVEVDNQLYAALGSNQTTVNSFLGNLVGAASTIYQRELKTDLVLVFSRTQQTSTEPFTYPANGADTARVLAELGAIWHNSPPSAVPHSSVIRLSGSSILAGIAWLGTACNPSDFPTTNGYGGRYAYCGGLNATTGVTGATVPNPDANAPTYTLPSTNYWALLELTHELGHNVDGDHTHCISLTAADKTTFGVTRNYVDSCEYNESGCVSDGGTPHFGTASDVPPEKATIMSYCHNVSPSFSTNSRFIFGKAGEPSIKVINGGTGTPHGGINPYLVSVTPDSPTISAPLSIVNGTTATASTTNAGLTYDWSITNGTIVGASTGASITFSGTTDPVTLRVRATNATTGCAASDVRTVTFVTCVAPAITVQPSGGAITQGASRTLSVTATGAPLSYQWYIGAPGVITYPIPGATGSSVSVGPGSDTAYWVRVSTQCGTVDSTGATVTVTSSTTTSSFFLVTPCRVLDTRGGSPIASGAVRNLAVAGVCAIPSGATALSANVTVVAPPGSGFATVYPGPAASTRPGTSTINFSPNRTLANDAQLRVGSDGTINIYNGGSGSLNVLIDVNGYFK